VPCACPTQAASYDLATVSTNKIAGSIVLVSSATARVGLFNHEAIATAKAGMRGLIYSAAATDARCDVRVSVVVPGPVRTPLTERTGNEASGSLLVRWSLPRRGRSLTRECPLRGGSFRSWLNLLGWQELARVGAVQHPLLWGRAA
jgi:NAD(P)-dependent dehydrogenase (short-subunit alcohol dehydrogenase family)